MGSTGIGGAIVWVINYGSADGVTNPLRDAMGKAFLEKGTGNAVELLAAFGQNAKAVRKKRGGHVHPG